MGPYLHRPMSLEERTEREVDYFVNVLHLDPFKHVLDCPCGYGRHSLNLLQRGIEVTGVDLNPYFISLINEKICELNFNRARAHFMVGDMRDIPVDDNTFDGAVNAFTSFGFFEDEQEDEKVLREYFRALKPGGKLLIHFDYNYYRIINSTWEELEYRLLRDGATLFVDDDYDPSAKRIYGRWEIIKCAGDPPFEREYSLRVSSPDELMSMLANRGFINISIHGDLEEPLKKLDTESRETVVLAEKPAN